MSFKTILLVASCLTSVASRVHADDTDIEVKSFEYIDVVETTDGSIWKGVIVEQSPNVSYKIVTSDGSLHVIKADDVVKLSKQRNKEYRATSRETGVGGLVGHLDDDGLTKRFEPSGPSLPAPMARSGLRFDPELSLVFPLGDITANNTSYTPSVRLGYEAVLGNVGIGGGALARYTYWQLPTMTSDELTTTELHAYVRAALHVSRVAIYGGGSIGLDLNYAYVSQAMTSKMTAGIGLNLEGGVEILATPSLAFKAGIDYHPGTDTILDGVPGSISYLSLMIGASVRI